MEWVDAAETADDWKYRRGYLAGHLKSRLLLEVMIGQAEIGDEQWVQQQLVKELREPAMRLLTGEQEREAEQVVAKVRLGPREAALAVEQGASTRRNSTRR